jgi:hypothetical protein
MARFQKTFPAPKGVREFVAITIQEVTGEEEIQAGMLADAHKGKSGRDWSPLIEMVKLSIVSFVDSEGNTQTTTAPFDAFDKWSSRARNAVMAFYNDVNGLDEQDLKACVAAATAAGQTPKTTPTKDEAPIVAPNGG